MSRRRNLTEVERRRHDRSAMLQWTALGLVIALGLIATLVFTSGGGGLGGGHLNAPADTIVTDAH